MTNTPPQRPPFPDPRHRPPGFGQPDQPQWPHQSDPNPQSPPNADTGPPPPYQPDQNQAPGPRNADTGPPPPYQPDQNQIPGPRNADTGPPPPYQPDQNPQSAGPWQQHPPAFGGHAPNHQFPGDQDQTTLGTGEQVELASPGNRLLAHIIDMLILMVMGFLFGILDAISSLLLPYSEMLSLYLTLFPLVIGILYIVVLIALKGQTLGKMAMKVRVVQEDDGSIPGWGKSIIRWLVPSILFIVICPGLICYLSIIWDKRKQGWHDKVANTLVIKVRDDYRNQPNQPHQPNHATSAESAEHAKLVANHQPGNSSAATAAAARSSSRSVEM